MNSIVWFTSSDKTSVFVLLIGNIVFSLAQELKMSFFYLTKVHLVTFYSYYLSQALNSMQ